MEAGAVASVSALRIKVSLANEELSVVILFSFYFPVVEKVANCAIRHLGSTSFVKYFGLFAFVQFMNRSVKDMPNI